MSLRIDSHHHLWQYAEAEFGWIDQDMQVLKRNYLPADIHTELKQSGLTQSVAVQARQTVEETRWLLSLTDNWDFIAGVVGWVPLAAPNVAETLEEFGSHRRLVGVRHVLQDEPDPEYMLQPDFNRGIDALHRFDLAYDLLVFEDQLPQSLQFVDRHPNQRIVIDHAAKPKIRQHSFDRWAKYMTAMANRETTFCKISGMVTEADHKTWKDGDLTPYLDLLFDVFGPSRLLFGSDWPVCLLATTYSRWVETVRAYCSRLSHDEQKWVFGKAAAAAYRLEAA